MLYRFAAACALIVEVLTALHILNVPALHQPGPLFITGVLFIIAFVLTETWDCLFHFFRSVCRAVKGLIKEEKEKN